MRRSARRADAARCGERGSLRTWRALAIVLLVVLAGLAALALWPEGESAGPRAGAPAPVAGTDAHEAEAGALYTCGMHPQVLSRTPGTCPICQMDLTPVKVQAPAPAAREADMAISISPVVVQNMGVRTAAVERRRVVRTVRTVGSIDYDEQYVRDVTTKFDGWIEELYADYTGQQVERGMPLFRVYSPELYSSQEEYLLALRNKDAVSSKVLPQAARDMRSLAESARLRLELFDISPDQIDELVRRGKPAKTMTIRSPHTGIIVEKAARDGMQVRPGMKLYTIADLSRVWVYVDIYENEVSFVKLGQDATMELSYLPGKVFHGKVIYVYPFVETDTRTVKVRLEFDNPHLQLKPGMFADVQIEADLGRENLQVPRSAVIDTGRRQVAFVALGEGRFEPRTLRTGVSLGDDAVEILEGLGEGELVVTSGQFLLDSESKLREAVLKMIEQGDTPAGSAVVEHAERGRPEQPLHERHGRERHDRADELAARGPSTGSAADLAALARPVIERYLDLQEILSQDEDGRLEAAVDAFEAPMAALGAGAQGAAAGHAAVRERMNDAARAVAGMRGRSIDTVRAQFSDLSREITGLVALVGPANIGVQLYAFHCPMAGGGWLQREEKAGNPYYGFSMNQCGDPVSLLKER